MECLWDTQTTLTMQSWNKAWQQAKIKMKHTPAQYANPLPHQACYIIPQAPSSSTCTVQSSLTLAGSTLWILFFFFWILNALICTYVCPCCTVSHFELCAWNDGVFMYVTLGSHGVEKLGALPCTSGESVSLNREEPWYRHCAFLSREGDCARGKEDILWPCDSSVCVCLCLCMVVCMYVCVCLCVHVHVCACARRPCVLISSVSL